jgi:hypothetical protein
MRRIALIIAVALAGACHEQVKSKSPLEKKLDDLAVFALGHPLPANELASKAKAVESGGLKYDDYIDGLLQEPMVPRLPRDIVMGSTSPQKDRHPLPAQFTLRSSKDKESGEKIYFLRNRCSSADAVRVKPWWSPDKEILVCPDSYRPEVLADKEGRACGAQMTWPRDNDACGCGPWMMFCTQDHDQWQHSLERIQQEPIETASYVVENDLPVEQIFTMNETVRNNVTEFIYRRARVLAGEDANKLFPVEGFGDYKGKLNPRPEAIPGEMAGVLSTPALTYSSDALRGVMRNYYDYLWCSGQQSSRVTTQSVLGLGTVDLRVGDGWKKLASMNICTDCHARLDYGMQFFWGFPSATAGVDFNPKMVLPGEGPLYRRNINDTIGTAALTPSGFAKLVTAAPEFGDCMSRRVVDHVFNGTDTAKDYQAVRDEFDKSHRIKKMLRVALVRFANRKDGAPDHSPEKSDEAAAATTPPSASADKIALTPALQKMIKRDCKECHDKDEGLNLMVQALDKDTLAKMLDRVGFGAMPKNSEGIDDGERRAFVQELAQLIYASADERKLAVDYYADGMHGLPVHRFASEVNNIASSVQSSAPKLDSKAKAVNGFKPAATESSVAQGLMSYSPSVAVATAVSALRTCKEAGFKGADLERCVERATALDNVVAGPMPHGTN